jgi:hypothetical protein
MTIAALVVFAALLAAWLFAPAERRQRHMHPEHHALELAADAAA